MGVTNRKEIEINMLKQSTINQRLQESKDISVLVFPDKKGEINKHHPRSGQNVHNQGREPKNKTLYLRKVYQTHTSLCYPVE
jgi:hypothetical protein